jgi:Ankyrin repeats (3 copies)
MWGSSANTSEEGSDGTNLLDQMMGRHTLKESEQPQERSSSRKDLPPLFWFMETGDWDKAVERIHRHPKEVKTWATMRTKTNDGSGTTTMTTKRLALHHACFKLRAAGATPPRAKDDPFVEVCRFLLLLIKLYPEAAQKRETRHGCLPLHLAAFASCAPRDGGDDVEGPLPTSSLQSAPPPVAIRQSSDSTNDTQQTNMSAVHAEEVYTGAMSDVKLRAAAAQKVDNPNVSVSMRPNQGYSAKREEMLVQLINALLDAYPKGARVDSEGGRLPLHTACAGRATPRVISTLITAYPAAARQRNKDGFLPLHLAAHWGVSHIAVAISLLKVYPDATVGRNRWERTPLEEALCMAGENGRPHQAALVRALRKHPSWWTQPQSDFRLSAVGPARLAAAPHPHKPVSTIIDIDESLPSNDTSFDEQLRLQGIHRTHHLTVEIEGDNKDDDMYVFVVKICF